MKEWPILELQEMTRVLHAVLYPIVFISFHDRYWQEGVLKPLKSYHFLNIFSRCDLFPQVFRQVNEWPILELHEMKRVSHAVCVSNCFYFV